MRFSATAIAASLSIGAAVAGPVGVPAAPSSVAGLAARAVQTATAIPDAPPLGPLAVKKDVGRAVAGRAETREGIHLVNCHRTSEKWLSSAIVYCPDDGHCQGLPLQQNLVERDLVKWEGIVGSVEFTATGVSFSWDIEADGWSKPKYSAVGTAKNDFHEDYTVYRDDLRILYSTPSGLLCRSLYYILRVESES